MIEMRIVCKKVRTPSRNNAIMKTSPGAHPWLKLSCDNFCSSRFHLNCTSSFVLLDPEFAESGVSIFHFHYEHERELELLSIPEASSGDVPPIITTAVEGAASDIKLHRLLSAPLYRLSRQKLRP
uniref:Uncharacterized protein n=1 Tax=Talaromyces marneffei PM1 TaxID=1077442 RepID=A0A093UTM3_TALMA